MGHLKHIGRVGALAVALGIGAAVAAAPAIGNAAPSDSALKPKFFADERSPVDGFALAGEWIRHQRRIGWAERVAGVGRLAVEIVAAHYQRAQPGQSASPEACTHPPHPVMTKTPTATTRSRNPTMVGTDHGPSAHGALCPMRATQTSCRPLVTSVPGWATIKHPLRCSTAVVDRIQERGIGPGPWTPTLRRTRWTG